jgi:hypothetical protein
MNTDVTQTRTIGNLDPMRSPFGKLFNEEQNPATWYGTTHELLINFIARGKSGQEIYTQIQANYLDAAAPDKSECAVVDNWLTTARRTRGQWAWSRQLGQQFDITYPNSDPTTSW